MYRPGALAPAGARGRSAVSLSMREGPAMTASVDALVHRNLMDVFNERDPARRAKAVAEIYTEDVTFTDAAGSITGREALDRKAQEILDGAPAEFVFRPAGPSRTAGDLGVLSWELGPPGAAPVVSGMDISLIRDGRIASVHTLLDG